MSSRFDGKSAIVTGAGQGLGAAVAHKISSEGGRVMVVDIDGENAERVAAELPVEGIGVRADVTSEAEVDEYTRLAVERFGRLDCVHNNAGIIGAIAMITDITAADLDRTLGVNSRGMFYGVRAAMRAMSKSGGGAIVNTSSVMGLMGAKGVAPYVMSKHAAIGLTKCAAMEGAPLGIRVNVVCPGIVDTPMNRQSESAAGEGDEQKGREMLESTIAIGRYAEPEEVASIVAWLLSDEGAYANGAVFTVDAGMTAGNDVLG